MSKHEQNVMAYREYLEPRIENSSFALHTQFEQQIRESLGYFANPERNEREDINMLSELLEAGIDPKRAKRLGLLHEYDTCLQDLFEPESLVMTHESVIEEFIRESWGRNITYPNFMQAVGAVGGKEQFGENLLTIALSKKDRRNVSSPNISPEVFVWGRKVAEHLGGMKAPIPAVKAELEEVKELYPTIARKIQEEEKNQMDSNLNGKYNTTKKGRR